MSAVVGYESSSNRVARYSFKAPATGASGISLSGSGVSLGGGSSSAAIRYYITTSSTSHANAGSGSTYTGTLTLNVVSGEYKITGAANIILLPNATYYLWIFPGSTTYGWWYWISTMPLTTSGGAGLVYIDSGSSLAAYMPYIDTGSGWVQAMPYIDTGSEWKLSLMGKNTMWMCILFASRLFSKKMPPGQ